MGRDSAKPFLTGVIEGFYGRPWSQDMRSAYADYLVALGLNTFLYCPKSDPFLRKQWRANWPESQWQGLLALSQHYRKRGLQWGVGISPFALYLDYGASQREALKRKVARLADLEAPLLAVLFDDMPGDLDSLASRQSEIVADISSWLPGVRIMVCPTYYAFDPVLETHFGAMPADYWRTLGAELPPHADVFWTGNQVCSESIRRADIEQICAELGRPVMLWDNYPVNDGAKRSNFLYLEKLANRAQLPETLVSGHLCNPMNQALLSLPALTGLAELYGRPEVDPEWLNDTLGGAAWARMQQDRQLFGESGLSGMGEARCRELAQLYGQLNSEAAQEVADWLSGKYQFDPSCLTD